MSSDRASDSRSASTRLEVGWVSGAHGLRGGLTVRTHDPGSTALEPGVEIVLVERGGGLERSFVILSAESQPGKAGRWRVHLEGVDDREQAEALHGFRIEIARADLPALQDDEFYLADAIGIPVQRQLDGVIQSLGVVIGVVTGGAQDLLEVEWRSAEGRHERWLLPAIPQFIRDVDPTRVLVELPLGFLPEELE